ncbi:hypothetical protein BGX28_000729, partial [Mortierella sp. GBA30]
TRLVPKELHEHLQSVLTENNGRQPRRAKGLSSSLTQTTLDMAKDKKIRPGLGDMAAPSMDTKASKSPKKSESRRERNVDPESLSAIQEKISKFQPRIDSLLPRMLNKSPAAITTTSELASKNAASSTAPKRSFADASMSEALPKKSSGSEARSTATDRKIAATKSPAGQTSSSSSAAKARKGPANIVSIADRLPKGSRTKPITPLSSTQPKSPRIRAGVVPEEAVIHLSSLPSSSSQNSEEVVSESSRRQLAIEVDKDYSSDDEPLVDRRRQQPYTTEAKKANFDTSAPVTYDTSESASKAGAISTNTAMAAGTAAGTAFKMPSIISIENSKSELDASIIPSIDDERIHDWMGGVNEAMSRDSGAFSVCPKLQSAAEAVAAASTLAAEAKTTVTAATTVISATVDNKAGKRDSSRILVKDSLSSAPRISLFREDSHAIKEAIATHPKADDTQESDHDGDVSTVVIGAQPTQDSFALRSLPSYTCDKKSEVLEGYSSHHDDERRLQQQQQQQQHPPSLPSLPSGLTASCLRELGLEKKRKNASQESRNARWKRQPGAVLSHGQAEDDTYEDMILGQEEAFPSSIDEAPESLPLPDSTTLSYSELEAPVYKFALPSRLQQDHDLEQASDHQINDDDTQELPQLSAIQDSFSFPSPPSQISFSVSLPTMPSFPSTLRSDPSLIILGSQYHETQEEQEQS